MSMLRRKVAERLVSVKNETAMLTTFNEVDMKPVMDLRKKHKDAFREQFGVGLGFMGFFTKAVTTALAEFPAINAQIDGKELIYHDYADVCIAVSSPKGAYGSCRSKCRDHEFGRNRSRNQTLGDSRTRRRTHR